MQFSITSSPPARQRSECIVLPVFASRTLGEAAAAADRAARGQLSEWLESSPQDGSVRCSPVTFYGLRGVHAARVVVVGFGEAERLDEAIFLKALRKAAEAAQSCGAASAAIYLDGLAVAERDGYWLTRQCVEVFQAQAYRFDELKSKRPANGPTKLKRVQVAGTAGGDPKRARRALAHGEAIARGVALARTLGNRPSNICTPAHLADEARALARSHPKLSVKVIEQAQMRRLGMGSLLAVAKGSREAPKLIVLRYNGGKARARPAALVGKGVTFDTGGVSLKPSSAMDEMKFDMCGAASVLGAMSAVARLSLPINVVALIPATENMPDGNATKPGDIVTTLSGQTVEILNTDAEGRLILCDALTYAERFKPDTVIDVATLTGACVVALGAPASGLWANDEELARELLDAGRDACDRAWHMPLWPEYEEALRSNFADVANVGGREGGAITAAIFLSRFTRGVRWAHLDIAGTAWKQGKAKGATGRPVALLCQYLLSRAGDAG